MNFIVKLAIILASIQHILSANILFIHPLLSPSHHIWNSRLARGLAKAGHNVTFFSVDPPNLKTNNLHYIVHKGARENFYEGEGKVDLIEYSRQSSNNKFKGAFVTSDYCLKTCEAIYKTKNGFSELLSYSDDFKFDIVVNDFTCGPCLLPLIHKFKYPPIVGVSAFLNPSYTYFTIGGYKYPAYVPHYLMNIQPPLTILQRCYNMIIYLLEAM